VFTHRSRPARWVVAKSAKRFVMARDLDELVRDFRERPLDAGSYRFVAANAMTMKFRQDARCVDHACARAVFAAATAVLVGRLPFLTVGGTTPGRGPGSLLPNVRRQRRRPVTPRARVADGSSPNRARYARAKRPRLEKPNW